MHSGTNPESAKEWALRVCAGSLGKTGVCTRGGYSKTWKIQIVLKQNRDPVYKNEISSYGCSQSKPQSKP
jgi:hypothetical protein